MLDELKDVLDEIEDEGGAVSYARLYALSDLSGERLTHFRVVWARFPAGLRYRLMGRLVGMAETTFEVNFDAIFREALYDAEPGVRALAIEGLWEDESTTLVGPFLSLLRADPSTAVRAAAAKGLGRFVLAGELEKLEAAVEERIILELLTVLHLAGEDIEVRRRALEAVAYACRPETLEALEIAYYDEVEAMRVSAVTGMGRSCDDKWEAIVLDELESHSAPMRYAAALATGELGLRKAVPRLAALLEDPDRQISEAAIWSLGQIGGTAAKQALMAAYEGADQEMEAALDDALAEHALAEGNIDFFARDLDGGGKDAGLEDDEFLTLWSAGEDEDGAYGEEEDDDDALADDWDADDF